MPRSVCPKCKEELEGTLEKIQGHVRRCIGSGKSRRRDKSNTGAVGDPELMAVAFFIPGALTPSNNQLIRMNPRQQYRLKKDWLGLLMPYLKSLPSAKPGSRYSVTIIRRSTKKLDKDNLYGGCKALLDVIRDARLIDDDDPDSIELSEYQEVVKKSEVGMYFKVERIQ